MAGILVLNDLNDSVPGATGSVRYAMDFGNLEEITAGGVISSCAISISPTTSPALSLISNSTTIDGGYLVSALFTGGTAGTYLVTFTPTLSTGQILPPRIGTLILQ